jgi:hypothetical protein
MTTEPVHTPPSEQTTRPPATVIDTNAWTLIQELQDENKRLRQMVIDLGDVITRVVVDGR